MQSQSRTINRPIKNRGMWRRRSHLDGTCDVFAEGRGGLLCSESCQVGKRDVQTSLPSAFERILR